MSSVQYLVLAGVGAGEDLYRQLVSRKVEIVRALPLVDGFVCLLPETNVQKLNSLSSVQWVEQDYVIYVVGRETGYGRTVLFDSVPWGVRRIGAPKVWEQTRGQGVRVGILDTGIDLNHPDLLPNLVKGVNILNPDEPPEDDHGHGTHVAGIVGAARTGGGVIGVAPEAGLVPIKAFNDKGAARLSAVVQGIEWAVRNHIHVLNMSFGMSMASLALRRAVNAAHQQGIVLVAATGNDGRKSAAGYPARLQGVLGIGASTILDEVADFSTGGYGLDLVAPGKDILSTYLGGSIKTMSGTSMAAAHVSGVAALVLAWRPELSPDEVYDLLVEAAEPLAGAAASEQGAGLPDVARVLA